MMAVSWNVTQCFRKKYLINMFNAIFPEHLAYQRIKNWTVFFFLLLRKTFGLYIFQTSSWQNIEVLTCKSSLCGLQNLWSMSSIVPANCHQTGLVLNMHKFWISNRRTGRIYHFLRENSLWVPIFQAQLLLNTP